MLTHVFLPLLSWPFLFNFKGPPFSNTDAGSPAMEAAAWVAGDWELLPDGLRVIGNDIDAPPLLGVMICFPWDGNERHTLKNVSELKDGEMLCAVV